MKRILSALCIIVVFWVGLAHAEKGFGTIEVATIDTDATFDPIATTTVTAQYFVIKARGTTTWYFAKTASPGSAYMTIADGASITVSFDRSATAPYTFGYGQSSSGSLVIEILPFNE